MAEQLEVDVFWSFRSPWSYLATPRLREWQERFLLKVNLRVVYPIAIRTPEFFDQVSLSGSPILAKTCAESPNSSIFPLFSQA